MVQCIPRNIRMVHTLSCFIGVWQVLTIDYIHILQGCYIVAIIFMWWVASLMSLNSFPDDHLQCAAMFQYAYWYLKSVLFHISVLYCVGNKTYYYSTCITKLLLLSYCFQVQHDGGRRLYRRLNQLVKEPNKNSVVFCNEFHKYAYIPREPGMSLQQWQNR